MIDIFQIVRLNEPDNYYSVINKFDINLLNEQNQNLLHEAIASKSNEIAFDLISKEINVNQKDDKGQTPLQYAAAHNQINLARQIINAGADVNIRDNFGNNALWTAVFNAHGSYELVKLILEKKGDAFTKNNAGRSPLDFANQINDKNLIDLLAKH